MSSVFIRLVDELILGRRTASWSWFQTRTLPTSPWLHDGSMIHATHAYGQCCSSPPKSNCLWTGWLYLCVVPKSTVPMISSESNFYVHHIVSMFLLVGYTNLLFVRCIGSYWVYCWLRFPGWSSNWYCGMVGEAHWRRWLCSFWLQQPAWAAQNIEQRPWQCQHSNAMGYLEKP